MCKFVFIHFVIVLFFVNKLCIAQDIPIYREYKEAIVNKTRNYQGTPGVNYWQNKAIYHLDAELDLVKSILYGRGQIRYINNGPDTLDKIYIRLYQNMYAKGSTRNIGIKPQDIHEGIDITHFEINGKETDISNTKKIYIGNTLMRVNLDGGLEQGDSITFLIHWNFHIPEHTYLRMGRSDSTTFFIAYWYPQIAVYDDLFGWDRNSYLGLQEFYNDFSDFDVTIRVPFRNGVWSTGTLMNPDELFKSGMLNSFRNSQTSDEHFTLISRENVENGEALFKVDSGMHNWKYQAENVSDFAFATGDHFIWEASSLETSDSSRVHLHTIYRPEAYDFKNMLKWMRENLIYFAEEMPGTAYPFPSLTVSETVRDKGDGGMEFPMICNNPSSENFGRAIDIMSHEIAHSYFPFTVCTNETRNGWMDEGFAGFLPKDFMTKADSSRKRFQNYANITSILGDYSTDLPIFTPTFSLDSYTLFNPTYSKPALALLYLSEIIGKEEFAKICSEFIENWKFKHASPYDFFFFFNNHTDHDLEGFFRKWYFERHYPDLGIGEFSRITGDKTLEIINKGGLPLPIYLKVYYSEGESWIYEKSAEIWEKGENKIKIQLENEPIKIILGNNEIPDSYKDDNIWEK